MRCLSQKVAASFVVKARNASMCATNPAFDGWILEMDFLMQIRVQPEITLHMHDNNNPTNKKIVWKNLGDLNKLDLSNPPAEIKTGWWIPTEEAMTLCASRLKNSMSMCNLSKSLVQTRTVSSNPVL